MNNKKQAQALRKVALSLFRVVYWPAVLTPLLIKNMRYRVPGTFSCDPTIEFTYRDVYVFGIRVARIQEP